tara:strand:- start:7118 stop:9253 length:2136 start_codon:yes stop_codon:yes gene_type:complete
LDHVRHKKKVFIELPLVEIEIQTLLSLGYKIEIVEKNLKDFYESRSNRLSRWRGNFKLGSMAGNYTLSELEAELDTLHILYPSLVSQKMSIGKSHEGRDIWAIKVSDNVDLNENAIIELEPLVLYTGLTHAREPLSMMNLIYFIRHLCENYSIKKLETYLVDNREMWFVPCVNPDGYVYNESIAPNGGGMHRKNRKDTGCGQETTRGVDLNRNFDFAWGANDLGSSPDPCSPIYRGKSPFSEPETSVLKDFMMLKNFKNVLHYHTYTNLLIHPYGDGSYPSEPDFSTFKFLADKMTYFNQYHIGTGIETVGYTVNGDAVDYSYVNGGMIAFTPEIGDWDDGFWPSPDRIVSLSEENVWSNLMFANYAGAVISVDKYSLEDEFLQPGENANIVGTIANHGLRASLGTIKGKVASLNNLVVVDSIAEWNLGKLEGRQVLDDSFKIPIKVKDTAAEGCLSGLIFHFFDNYDVLTDTIPLIIGPSSIVFYEDGESNINNWQTTEWGLINDPFSGSNAITDSPSGDYQPNSENILYLKKTLDLSKISNSRIEFWAKWDIEEDYDGVTIEVKVNNGEWESLRGQYTNKASGAGNGQPKGSFVYEGEQSKWVRESISLSQFSGFKNVNLRLVQRSDELVEGDGFIMDDIGIITHPEPNLISGDVNGDCLIDISDAIKLIDLIFIDDKINPEITRLADLNNDFQINVLDLVKLVNIILN